MANPTPPPPPQAPPPDQDAQGHKPNTGTRPPVTPVPKKPSPFDRGAQLNKAIEDAGG